MNKSFTKAKLLLVLFLGLNTTVLVSCKTANKYSKSLETKPPFTEVGMVTFNNYTNQPYNLQDFKTDFFTVVTSWKNNYTDIVDKSLRVKIPAGNVNQGFYPQFDIVDGASYEVTFDVKFAKGFDWRAGGKLGFGFGIGDVIAGGDATNGNGGSARIMWNQTAAGKIIFKPYLYYTGMPNKYGTNVVNTAFYPQLGSITDDTWYTIKIRVKSNTNYEANGLIQIKINGLLILNNNYINWGDNSGGKNKGWIKTLMFQTFRGGQGAEWESNLQSYLMYDNIKVTKDPIEPF